MKNEQFKIKNYQLFNNFRFLMNSKFNKESIKHGNSWKTQEIALLQQFFKQHIEKYWSHFNLYDIKYISEINKNNASVLCNDLIDIANYSLIMFNRIHQLIKKDDLINERTFKL